LGGKRGSWLTPSTSGPVKKKGKRDMRKSRASDLHYCVVREKEKERKKKGGLFFFLFRSAKRKKEKERGRPQERGGKGSDGHDP